MEPEKLPQNNELNNLYKQIIKDVLTAMVKKNEIPQQYMDKVLAQVAAEENTFVDELDARASAHERLEPIDNVVDFLKQLNEMEMGLAAMSGNITLNLEKHSGPKELIGTTNQEILAQLSSLQAEIENVSSQIRKIRGQYYK